MYAIWDGEGMLGEVVVKVPARDIIAYSRAILGSAFDALDDAMEDRSGTSDTNHTIAHRSTIGISRPDTNNHIRCVANRPVILKAIRRTGFSGHLVITRSTQGSIVAASRLPVSKGQNMIVTKFQLAIRFVDQHGGHHIGNLRSEDLRRIWVSGIVMIEVISVIVPDIQNTMRLNMHPIIGKSLISTHHL